MSLRTGTRQSRVFASGKPARTCTLAHNCARGDIYYGCGVTAHVYNGDRHDFSDEDIACFVTLGRVEGVSAEPSNQRVSYSCAKISRTGIGYDGQMDDNKECREQCLRLIRKFRECESVRVISSERVDGDN